MSALRVACVQLDSRDAGTREGRLERARELLRGRQIDLAVLPELWPVGFFQFERYEERAETLEGPTLSAIGDLARELQAHVHSGSIIERRRDGGLSNTSVLFDPEGNRVLEYRKRHLFGYRSGEADLLVPGDRVEAATTPFGVVGITTCYDLRFPELYLDLVAQGAQFVVVASAWPHERLEHWRLLTRTRALENLVYLVACNASGRDAGVLLGGHSVVVDPWGDVVTEAGPEEGLVLCEIEPDRVNEVRSEFPVLDDRLRSARPAPRRSHPARDAAHHR